MLLKLNMFTEQVSNRIPHNSIADLLLTKNAQSHSVKGRGEDIRGSERGIKGTLSRGPEASTTPS